MEYTASQIAEILDGSIVGDKDARVSTLAKIEEATEGSLAFLANPKYTPFVYSTKASITLVSESFQPEKEIHTTLIKVSDPYQSFTTMLSQFNGASKEFKGIHNHTVIDSSATIGKNSYVGAFTVIQNGVKIGNNVKIHDHVVIESDVIIGDNTTIFSGTKILRQSEIGANCILHNNVVVGSDGFGFSPTAAGSYEKVPQTGSVLIEDDVEIGANTTIDRATLGQTIIRKGVKLDNLIQIAHNVEIGSHTVIAAQSGVAGSTKIGSHCVIGGQAGIAGHLKIGDRVQIQGKTGVLRNLKDGEKVMGFPALDYRSYNKSYIHFKNLPKHIETLHKLQKNQSQNG
jgi:UDP-3-O-[3-hydroxymyristoyl] glucosamine N-acyltransferase